MNKQRDLLQKNLKSDTLWTFHFENSFARRHSKVCKVLSSSHVAADLEVSRGNVAHLFYIIINNLLLLFNDINQIGVILISPCLNWQICHR